MQPLDKDKKFSPIAQINKPAGLNALKLNHSRTMKSDLKHSSSQQAFQHKSLLEISKYALDDANSKILILEEKNYTLIESYKTMRYSFLKELQAYKDQLFKLEKYPENFEPINVQFFSGLEILDDRTRELLDKKISYITDDYNFKLLRMQKHQMALEDKITKFEKLCKGKNVAVSINELNADDIVSKLYIVEGESLPIWEAFGKHYGVGFFNKMIEKEFGINPDTHEEIGNRFGQEVNNIRIEMSAKLDKISKEAKSQIDMLKVKLRQKSTEYLAIKEEQEDEITKIKQEIQKQ